MNSFGSLSVLWGLSGSTYVKILIVDPFTGIRVSLVSMSIVELIMDDIEVAKSDYITVFDDLELIFSLFTLKSGSVSEAGLKSVSECVESKFEPMKKYYSKKLTYKFFFLTWN